MKKAIYIIGFASLLIGFLVALGTMIAIGFDFGRLTNYNESTDDISADFDSITIDAQSMDITIKPSSNEKCSLYTKCEDGFAVEHTEENGELKIKVTEDSSAIFNIIGNSGMVLYLPKSLYKALSINGSASDVEVIGIGFETAKIAVSSGDVKINSGANILDVETTTGDVDIEKIESQNVSVKVSTGDISIKKAKVSGNATISSSSGDVEIEGADVGGLLKISTSTGEIGKESVNANGLSIKTNSGDIELENVIILTEMKLETSSGEIELHRCDAKNLSIETSSGDVEGTLLSSKIFYTSSDTGDISVPMSSEGGVCQIKTNSGDIRFSIVK